MIAPAGDPSDAGRTFSSRRAIAPMLWVLFLISLVELSVVHLLVASWSQRTALAISALTLPAVAWLGIAIASLSRLPSRCDGDDLRLRAGLLRSATVPLASIVGLRPVIDAAALRAPDVLNLAMVSFPNVLIDLSPPLVRRGRVYGAVAHPLDDPVAFATTLARLGVPS